MYDVIDIAKKFLKEGSYDAAVGGEYMSESRLQKLLYMLQKYYVATFEKPLFNEPIIATENGPVCQKVRDYFGENGGHGIVFDGDVITLDREDEEMFDYVWRLHRVYSSLGLLKKIKEDKEFMKGAFADDHIIKFYALKLID